MAACDILDLCIEVTTDPENSNIVLIRETDPDSGSGPDVWVSTTRANWLKFVAEVKAGEHDNV